MERQSKYTMHTHIYISNVYFTCVFSVIHTGEFNLVLEGKQKKWVRCRQISLSNIWKKEISYFNWRKTVYHFDCCKFSLDWIYFLKRFWILASSLLLQSTWDLGWTVLFLPYCPSFYPYIYIYPHIYIYTYSGLLFLCQEAGLQIPNESAIIFSELGELKICTVSSHHSALYIDNSQILPLQQFHV